MKKIIVDQNSCIGCGACVAIDDTHFDFNEDGKSTVISQENLDDSNLANAMESCPVAAISIGEADTSCKCGDNCTCGDNCECGDDCACHTKEDECCGGCEGCAGCEK